MQDYDDIDFYQRQLAAAGIKQEDFNMADYCGLTSSELQSIVNVVIKSYGEIMARRAAK